MAQLDIDDSVAFEILKQLRAELRLNPEQDAIALDVLQTPVDKLTVTQYEFARRMAGMSSNPYWINQEQRIEKTVQIRWKGTRKMTVENILTIYKMAKPEEKT